MPPSFHVLFTVNLFFPFLSCPNTLSSETGMDLDTWVSLHVQRHKERSVVLAQKMSVTSPDWKLRLAESNRTQVIVSQDGSGDFMTINEAVTNIPLHNTRRVVIRINSGVYREKVNIPKTMRFVTLVGNASDPPTITGNDTASTNSAPHVVGRRGEQAAALRISGTKAAFYSCSFYGSQDTLYDHKGLHYFNNCLIQGSVDFIFGYGTSLYENCYLNSVTKKVASVTAQKRSDSSIASGFSFKNCTVTGSGSIYLGRAWGDYSRVVFSYTFLDKIVLPQGWSDWGKTSRDRKVYYGEYKCSGGGANVTGRVTWARVLTDEEAMPFIGTYYIDGDSWLINPSL
ncbi:pectinesterase [Salvia divinorum]|uniref:Pectinesterase n=1 Tax=Salvia divinorum TaxID=28513 RepID=A0ABD1GFB3_SALDI